jgi:hypothetical protein
VRQFHLLVLLCVEVVRLVQRLAIEFNTQVHAKGKAALHLSMKDVWRIAAAQIEICNRTRQEAKYSVTPVQPSTTKTAEYWYWLASDA